MGATALAEANVTPAGELTLVNTTDATQLHQDIGDAPAFGRVLTHFEILK